MGMAGDSYLDWVAGWGVSEHRAALGLRAEQVSAVVAVDGPSPLPHPVT